MTTTTKVKLETCVAVALTNLFNTIHENSPSPLIVTLPPPLQKDYAPAEANYGGGEKYLRQILWNVFIQSFILVNSSVN